ncbi:hypothetical protein N7522_001941 [Penicillium canescens]|nr:hypothetical protein N7522_001941 [Penicillium canescens]
MMHAKETHGKAKRPAKRRPRTWSRLFPVTSPIGEWPLERPNGLATMYFGLAARINDTAIGCQSALPTAESMPFPSQRYAKQRIRLPHQLASRSGTE